MSRIVPLMERLSPSRFERALSGNVTEWARQLAVEVETIMAAHPDADPNDVRRTLILLQLSPLERLNRSLRRGRGFAAFKMRLKVLPLERILASKLAANREKDQLVIPALKSAIGVLTEKNRKKKTGGEDGKKSRGKSKKKRRNHGNHG